MLDIQSQAYLHLAKLITIAISVVSCSVTCEDSGFIQVSEKLYPISCWDASRLICDDYVGEKRVVCYQCCNTNGK